MKIRTRFAPSPTGYLHIGGARTALYSWLYARAQKGEFILRIEDTDLERSTQEAVEAILEGMAWLELAFDEGPYFQTQRLSRYNEVIEKLLHENKAYRCYCSKERLEKLRAQQIENKQKPRYDGYCANRVDHPSDQPFVIRFRNPSQGEVTFDDQVRGKITVQNSELDDLVILRTDGMPTYNFSVVVDDLDMKITHVIRGDDHINNTPRQINIFLALGEKPPLFAHVPMILGSDGKRLSKRHGAVSVLQYKEEGYLPCALLNYLVRLGWSYGDQEIFTKEEMVSHFSLKNISRSPATFNPEKLLWLNQHYIKTSDPAYIAKHLMWHLKQLHIDLKKGPPLEEIVVALRDRSKTLVEMAKQSRYLFEDAFEYDKDAAAKELTKEALPILEALANELAKVEQWNKENLHQVVSDIIVRTQVKMNKVAQPVRVAITGNTQSPSIDVTLQLLGKPKTLQRLSNAISFIRK